MNKAQNFNEKAEFTIYILCIFLTCAVCILIYADGNIRDEYNLSIDRFGLSRNLLLLIFFDAVFIVSKFFCRNSIVKKVTMAVFIPVLLISSITIGKSMVLARDIIQENRFRQTGFNQIRLNDLEDILKKEKSAVVYIGSEDCPECKETFSKLELYLYKNHISMLAYNIAEDRDGNFEKVEEVLDQLGVNEIPAILEIQQGTMSESYFAEDIEKKYKRP